MARPIIAFLSDFGLRDHYVGAMKGAALAVCPDATLVDLTHEIPPQDITAAAYELAAAAGYFPVETVFVAVVDPGVGGSRRGIAAEADGRRFVGPDNGLFTLIVSGAGSVRAVEITSPRHQRPAISRTFEGRDRFAPAAAWLAAGVPLGELGPDVSNLVTLDLPVPVTRGRTIVGCVIRVDRFGNAITNIAASAVASLPADLVVHAGDVEIAGLVPSYAHAAHGAPCALIGSSGHLEVALNGGSAAKTLRLERGAVVQVRPRAGA
ncbi:MAG: S-adenosyl-l-methionine hydroxide adenosyltransferase family protein [Vicinamibacterales bacterium]